MEERLYKSHDVEKAVIVLMRDLKRCILSSAPSYPAYLRLVY